MLLMFALPLLFFPKFNMFSVASNETAGLRLDDLILLAFGFFLICAHVYSQEKLYKLEGIILALTFLSFVSFTLNRLCFEVGFFYVEAKFFYVVRLLEYFMFFYVGALATQFFSLRALLQLFLGWNVLWIVTQKLHFIGGFTVSGYVTDVSERVQGIASFPSEMGLILNLLFCYFVFEDRNKVRFLSFFRSPYIRAIVYKLYLYCLFTFFGILIIYTGNRISFAALLLCFLFRLIQELRAKTIGSVTFLVILVPIVALSIGYVAWKTQGLYERSSGLFSWKNIELLSMVWDKIDVHHAPADYSVLDGGSYDMSWMIRIHKWMFMTKSCIECPQSIFLGLGPGVAGAALDGGVLRIITEYGLVGLVVFWSFFSILYRINIQTKWMMIAFFCNLIFFDAYLAYKTMSLLLFICGYLWSALETQRLPRLMTAPSQPEKGLAT